MPLTPSKSSHQPHTSRAIPGLRLHHSPSSPTTHYSSLKFRLTLAALLAATPAFANTPDNYTSPDNGLWSDPLNWSAGTPNNSTFDVTINNATPITVQLDTNETISTLLLSSPDSLNLLAATTLTLAGSSIVNTGTINLSGTASALAFTANTSLSGMGSILLADISNIFTGTSGVQIFTDNFISGSGNLGNGRLKFTNTGTISATSQTLTISANGNSNPFTNNGVLRADGGTLLLQNGTFNNAGGLVEARANSIVSIVTSTFVTGGTIHALSGGSLSLAGNLSNILIQSDPGSIVRFVNGIVLSNATLNGNTANVAFPLSISNSLTNNGVLFGQNLPISFTTDVTLGGSGTLSLAANGGINSTGFRLTNNSNIVNTGNFTISGIKLSNSGTITAAASNFFLTSVNASGAFINSGLLSANGGTLVINNSSLNNTGGIIEAANNSNASISGFIYGGILRARDGGTLALQGTLTNATLTSSNGGVVGLGGLFQTVTLAGYVPLYSVGGLSGTLANIGTLSLTGSLNPVTAFLGLVVTNATLSGSGTIIMNNSFSIISGGNVTSPAQSRRLVTDNFIVGQGNIGQGSMEITNNGTIAATTGILTIDTNRIGTFDENTNNGLYRADSGTLALTGSTCINTNGTIEAINGGAVIIWDPLTGGDLRTDTTSQIIIAPRLFTSTAPLLKDFTNEANLTFSTNLLMPGRSPGGNSQATGFNPVIGGTINNLGTMTLCPIALNLGTAEVYLTGHGTVTLSGVETQISGLASNPNASGSNRLITDNIIVGGGFIGGIHANITNTGAIIANASSGISITAAGTDGFYSSGLLRADAVPLALIDGPSLLGASPYFGTFAISGPIQAINNGTFLFAAGAGNVSVTSPITLSTGHLIVTGQSAITNVTGTGDVAINSAPGTSLTSDGITVDSLSLNGNSKHTIRPNNSSLGTTKLTTALTIASDTNSSFTSTLDLTNDKLILQTSNAADKSSKLSALGTALNSGMHNGDYLGTGITSSTVANDQSATGSHTTTLALYDNADPNLNLSTFGGLTADTNSIFITTALIADSNFDNTINSADFYAWYNHRLTQSFATSKGDFNHDGNIDGLDFDLWFNADGPTATDFLTTLGISQSGLSALRVGQRPPTQSPLRPGLDATPNLLATLTPNPEPASLILLLPALLTLTRRRTNK